MKTPCDEKPYDCPYSNDPTHHTCECFCSDTETYEAHYEEYEEYEEDCNG